MAVRDIKIFPESILRGKSHKVRTERREYVASIVEDLKDTATKHDALGLSAPQIGIPLRIIVVNVGGRYFHAINPEITIAYPGEELGEEACLSLPGISLVVPRAPRIKIRSTAGTADFKGLTARIVQHEIDHLDGLLIIDRSVL